MTYRSLDHTADAGIEASADSLPELFSEALRGMTDVLTDVDLVGGGVERRVELDSERLDGLLLELLGEALFRFEVDRELFREARLEIGENADGWGLAGTLVGERLDPARHPMKVMIKAVTYHRLEVARTEGGWRARVIFDI